MGSVWLTSKTGAAAKLTPCSIWSVPDPPGSRRGLVDLSIGHEEPENMVGVFDVEGHVDEDEDLQPDQRRRPAPKRLVEERARTLRFGEEREPVLDVERGIDGAEVEGTQEGLGRRGDGGVVAPQRLEVDLLRE